MKDLLIMSFKAQSKWLEPRILEKNKREHFKWASTILLDETKGKPYLLDSFLGSSIGSEMALIIYNEIETNLTARFETGIPLETSYYDF